MATKRALLDAEIRRVRLRSRPNKRKKAKPKIGPVGVVRPRIAPVRPAEAKAGARDVVKGDMTFAPIVPLPIKLSNQGGELASGFKVQLVFWGSVWTLPGTSPSVTDIAAATKSVLAGPYMASLRQYGVKRSTYGGALIVMSPQPPFNPNTFDDGDIQELVFSVLIDSGTYPEPDDDGGDNLYCVLMPANTTYGPGGLVGAHSTASDYDFPFDIDHAICAWIGNDSLDNMMATLTHEIAEMTTDPLTGIIEPYTWIVDGQPGGENEISDICSGKDAKLNGVEVESYWSKYDNACVIPTAYSVRRMLMWANKKLNGKGLRSLKSPMPSMNDWIVTL